MEYAAVEKSVAAVYGAKDDAYSGIMKHEKEALGIVERVSEDIRTRKIRASSLWTTPLNALLEEYVTFIKELYSMLMAGNNEGAMEKLNTPDGMIGGGITLLGVLLLIALLRV